MKEKYLDIKFAAKRFLSDWRIYESKLADSSEKLAEINSRLFSVSSCGCEPVMGGGSKREETLCVSLDKKSLEEIRKYEAEQYFKDAKPAWEKLTDDERWVLSVRFINDSYADEVRPIERIMRKFFCERSKAYKIVDDALAKFARFLY